MQDITALNKATVLNNMELNKAYYITDSRDNEQYCVAKLADGNLWSLDNLRLNLTDATILSNLSSDNTNASATSLGYLVNGGGTSSDQYATSGVSEWTSSTNYSSSHSFSDPLIATTGACDNASYCTNTPTNGNWSKDGFVNPLYVSEGYGSNKIGVFYNYCAASAGSFCYGNGTDEGASMNNAAEDICPAGWRLPTGDTNGEYHVLASTITGSTTGTYSLDDDTPIKNALSTTLHGSFFNGTISTEGSSSVFWTSTRHDNQYMHGLMTTSVAVGAVATGDRSYGYSVRCMLESPSYVVTVEMDENVSSVTITDSMNNTTTITTGGETITLKQGSTYTISASINSGYTIDAWVSANGAVGSIASTTTTYTVNGTGTLSIYTKVAE